MYINELVLFEIMGKIPRTFIFDIQMSKCEKSLKFNSLLLNITNHYTIHILVIVLFYFRELRTSQKEMCHLLIKVAIQQPEKDIIN